MTTTIQGTITRIEGNKITVKGEITLEAEEYYHLNYFQPGNVHITQTEIHYMIEGNTFNGKGYYITCRPTNTQKGDIHNDNT